jgi:predicted kinase
VTTPPTLVLTVGLPGVGKTTLARQLAQERRILRLTPDDWMAPLFGHNDAAGRRDILEGRMVWTAHEVLRSGASVILDFGCWSPEERYALRAIAESTGADFELRYVTIAEPERRARARSRRRHRQPSRAGNSGPAHDGPRCHVWMRRPTPEPPLAAYESLSRQPAAPLTAEPTAATVEEGTASKTRTVSMVGALVASQEAVAAGSALLPTTITTPPYG